MACISDMDIAGIYPQMQAELGSPMHTLATWEPERLLRLSRWKQTRGNPKDVVRSYAKAILALNDLHEAACCLQLPPAAVARASPVATKEPRNSKAIGNTPIESASSHALALSPANAPPQTKVQALAPQSLRLSRPSSEFLFAPSTRVLCVMRSWWMTVACLSEWALLLLQWMPVVIVLAGVAILLTDPTLMFTIVWEFLRLVPSAIRDRLSSSAQPAYHLAPLPLGGHHSRLMTSTATDPPPAFAHPAFEHPAPVGAPAIVLSVLSAQGGGAGIVYWLYHRSSLAAKTSSAP